MDIKHKREEKKGTFYTNENEKVLAELVYHIRGENIITIIHTEVNEDLQGNNLGNELVESAIEFARENRLKIIPMCSFAKTIIEKRKEELSDVLN